MKRPTEAIEALRSYITAFPERKIANKFPFARLAAEVLAYLDEMERTLPTPRPKHKTCRFCGGDGYVYVYSGEDQDGISYSRKKCRWCNETSTRTSA